MSAAFSGLRRWLVGAALLAAAPGVLAAGEIFEGPPVAVGNGQGRVVVATDEAGRPSAVSVVLSAAALEGLPQEASANGRHEYVLPMPAQAPPTGYQHVGLDWNPHGHRPEGIYTAPHFDVHFYLVSREEQLALSFQGEAAARGATAPEPALVPAGYFLPPDGAEEAMGMHAVDTLSREFQGGEFEASFLYGYYAGQQVFLEPMVTVDLLRSGRDITLPIRRPEAYSVTGYYPERWRIGFDAERGLHQISLLGLQAHTGQQGVAAR